jgi:hypothetical protein
MAEQHCGADSQRTSNPIRCAMYPAPDVRSRQVRAPCSVTVTVTVTVIPRLRSLNTYGGWGGEVQANLSPSIHQRTSGAQYYFSGSATTCT